MLRTLLFDLDGTLLPLDLDVFMKAYFGKLVHHVHGVIDEQQIVSEVWKATKAMISSEDASRSNEQVFKDVFFDSTGFKEEEFWPLFDSFYRDRFAELKEYTEPSPIARKICDTAVGKGYELVVATNPLFPRLAIDHRMEWAGIGDVPFRLVTSMENMHHCKPNPKYYMEILDILGREPQEAMMFGNDVKEDGAASRTGMETYLVTDYLVRHEQEHFNFTHEGSLADVLKFVQELPSVNAAVRD
ncbi:HAD family hydrolase [Alicyclobacillus sp. SO9]|uniref:HAD family hydrolase n=1 Tax=Alicyclobacillus sp. SO9 TaxID=2665646 RepID=UPI0018E90903|nr:HAD family hydrolase [Alicyclobacillus sp. SO9]QQE79608.1 HAD family hydrolase [Alicyclobacillus sp. SO9]